MKKVNYNGKKFDVGFIERIWQKYFGLPSKIRWFLNALQKDPLNSQEDFEHFGRTIYKLRKLQRDL